MQLQETKHSTTICCI